MSGVFDVLSLGEPLVRDYIFLFALGIAFTFYAIQKSETNTLLAMIVIAGVSWVAFTYLKQQSNTLKAVDTNTVEALNKEIKPREGEQIATFENMYAVRSLPKKGCKYLVHNELLVEIAVALGVIRTFDRARYADIITLLNQFQKTYMYILLDRYDAQHMISTFTDIGDSILELMYSLVLVLPDKFKHIYCVDPDKLVNDTIDKFIVLRRKMTSVLESYAKKELGVHTVPITLPKSSDTPFSIVNAQRLP